VSDRTVVVGTALYETERWAVTYAENAGFKVERVNHPGSHSQVAARDDIPFVEYHLRMHGSRYYWKRMRPGSPTG
jgi:hypothetical protein